MVCRVIKTIKGHQYLYEQTSYRVNGKVKTETRYIGAVDGVTGALKSSTSPVQEREAQTTHDTAQIITESEAEKLTDDTNTQNPPEEPQAKERGQEPEADIATLEKLTLQIKGDLQKHKIGESSAQAQYSSYTRFMQERGIKAKHIPPVSIVKGSAVEITKNRIGNGYKVTIPKSKQPGTRAEFWRSLRKAQAHSYLDALEQTDPKYFEGLKQNLTDSYQKQNRAIASYIMASKRKEVFNIGLTLHFLYSKMVSAWTQRHLAPQRIGLSDYSDRSTWKEDTAALMAEIQKDGWHDCYKKYMSELKRTESIQWKLIRDHRNASLLEVMSGKRRAIRQDIKKMNARRQAVFLTCDKISILSPLFDGYQSKIHHTDPFIHEGNWKRTRERWKRGISHNAPRLPFPWKVLNRIRRKIRKVLGSQAQIEKAFYTFDRDTQQIVVNRKDGKQHYIFDLKGNLIKQHLD